MVDGALVVAGGGGPVALEPVDRAFDGVPLLWTLPADALSSLDLARRRSLREELKDLHEVAPSARRLRELRERMSAIPPHRRDPHRRHQVAAEPHRVDGRLA